MDNDEYRRGRKTTHTVYGEAMGILAGDALLNYAFETAAIAFDIATVEEMPRIAKAIQVLSKKAGIYGMIGGQVCDIESENSIEPITAETILFIHAHKTAALIQASMMIGGILAGASQEQIAALEQKNHRKRADHGERRGIAHRAPHRLGKQEPHQRERKRKKRKKGQ
jgi:geranylgeranyl diphosphate synthase type II